jgi:hypothetical protein
MAPLAECRPHRDTSGDPLKYVMKYFNIKADETNLADVENLGDDISRLEPVRPPLAHWDTLGTLATSRALENRCQRAGNIGLTCANPGGRGRYRTADRWCVKPELYH